MFGPQFTNPIASAAKWIFFGFFGVILMGFLLGANIKDATWLNPGIAAAQAEKIRIETAHQQEMNKLQERMSTAQTEAEIQAIKREQGRLDAQYQHDLQILDQDVSNKQRMSDTINNIVIYVGKATGIAGVGSALIIAIAKAISIVLSTPKNQPPVRPSRSIPTMQVVKPLPERHPYDPWSSPAYRRGKRVVARQQELKEREEIAARMMIFRDPGRMSKEEYEKSPEVD